MELRITIPVDGKNYYYRLLYYTNYQEICIEGVIYLSLYKRHNHSYGMAAFIYKKKKYIYPRYYKSKRELYSAIQELLQKELNVDVQKEPGNPSGKPGIFFIKWGSDLVFEGRKLVLYRTKQNRPFVDLRLVKATNNFTVLNFVIRSIL